MADAPRMVCLDCNRPPLDAESLHCRRHLYLLERRRRRQRLSYRRDTWRRLAQRARAGLVEFSEVTL